MTQLVPIISLLTVIVISMLVVRIATVALTVTGLSQPLARFQARSAFTGAGFTTRESEKVVGHPVRRRIILLLMLLGNAGIVTAVSTLILSFVSAPQEAGIAGTIWFRIAALFTGLLALWALAHSRWIDKWLSNAITWALKHWTDLEIRDYASLLHLSGDYSVAELTIEDTDWLANRQLKEARLAEEGILVLGIDKIDGTFVGAPRGKTRFHPGDTLILYGSRKLLRQLDQRAAGSRGNWEHVQAVDEQVHIQEREEAIQKESETR